MTGGRTLGFLALATLLGLAGCERWCERNYRRRPTAATAAPGATTLLCAGFQLPGVAVRPGERRLDAPSVS